MDEQQDSEFERMIQCARPSQTADLGLLSYAAGLAAGQAVARQRRSQMISRWTRVASHAACAAVGAIVVWFGVARGLVENSEADKVATKAEAQLRASSSSATTTVESGEFNQTRAEQPDQILHMSRLTAASIGLGQRLDADPMRVRPRVHSLSAAETQRRQPEMH